MLLAGLQMDQDEVDKAIETGELFNTAGVRFASTWTINFLFYLDYDGRARQEAIV
jgi:hypothetical protein